MTGSISVVTDYGSLELNKQMKLIGKSFSSSKFCSYQPQGYWDFLLPHPNPI